LRGAEIDLAALPPLLGDVTFHCSLAHGSSSTYIINMKAIQVMFDERLLEKLEALDEVQKDGRSAVLRRAVEAYLRQRGRASIATQYKKAYRGGKGLGKEFAGWDEQGAWPDE
jgi:Ribbon-helix-helix protein, copG family